MCDAFFLFFDQENDVKITQEQVVSSYKSTQMPSPGHKINLLSLKFSLFPSFKALFSWYDQNKFSYQKENEGEINNKIK